VKASQTLEYFSSRQWTWTCNNLASLSKQMAKKEKDDFEVVKFRAKHSQIDNNKGGFFSFTFGIQDLSKIDWSDFMVNYIRAIATFILKEDPSTFVISPNRRLQILHFLHLLLIFMIVCILLTILSYFDPFDILVSL